MIDGVHRSLQASFQEGHRPDDGLGELADPSIVGQADRHRVEEVALLAADLLGRHEIGRLQHPQVLHDPEPRHVGQRLAQLAERLAIALEESIEEDPPTWVGECPKDRGHVVRHAGDVM